MDVRSTSLRRAGQALLASGMDIRVWALLFVVSGIVDRTWILAYPAYDLNVFGTTFSGWVGDFVNYQHPFFIGQSDTDSGINDNGPCGGPWF